jgi:hypothetical protein
MIGMKYPLYEGDKTMQKTLHTLQPFIPMVRRLFHLLSSLLKKISADIKPSI